MNPHENPRPAGEPPADDPDALYGDGADEPLAGEPLAHAENTAEAHGSTFSEPAGVEAMAQAVAEAIEKEKKERRAKKKDKKKGTLGTERGIETMFRTSYRTHLNLTTLADSKANIMISINGLILPILLGAISPKIDSNPWLLVPTTVLMLGCLISMVYAIRAARPRVSSEHVSLEDVRGGVANVLFFGNYTSLTRDEFETGLSELMEDTDRLYRNMMRDLYGMGAVLQTKFKLLRTAYTVFMVSIVLGVLLFIGTYYLVATGVLATETTTVTIEEAGGLFP